MKPLTILSTIVAVVLLYGSIFTPSHAQTPAQADTPTFYHLVPGTYVNGWPRFTISYPKDWLEARPRPDQVFVARAPEPVKLPPFYPSLMIVVAACPLPACVLENFAEHDVRFFRGIMKEATIASDRSSQLRDGTPAREIQIDVVGNEGPWTWFEVVAKKDDAAINAGVTSVGEPGKDLTAILYSLQLQPGKDEPVKVPPDVQAFLDGHCRASMAHDVAQLMAHYSDRYLNSGTRKGEMEQFHNRFIGMVTSCEIVVTDFVPAGDRAYLAGFVSGNWGKGPLHETSIIKENGGWKWYGNQRDVAP